MKNDEIDKNCCSDSRTDNHDGIALRKNSGSGNSTDKNGGSGNSADNHDGIVFMRKRVKLNSTNVYPRIRCYTFMMQVSYKRAHGEFWIRVCRPVVSTLFELTIFQAFLNSAYG